MSLVVEALAVERQHMRLLATSWRTVHAYIFCVLLGRSWSDLISEDEELWSPRLFRGGECRKEWKGESWCIKQSNLLEAIGPAIDVGLLAGVERERAACD